METGNRQRNVGVHFGHKHHDNMKKPMYHMYWSKDHMFSTQIFNFKRIYTPSKNLDIDEYLSLWKGRLKFRVYIPNKRERYGVKIYMLCESPSAYLYSFII